MKNIGVWGMDFLGGLVFSGIGIIVFLLVWVFLDKKRTFRFMKSMDEKKRELVEIINDADQMIEELNKFSDYIVNQMDLKNEELRINLKSAGENMKGLEKRASVLFGSADSGTINREITNSEEIKHIDVKFGAGDGHSIFKLNREPVFEETAFEAAAGNTAMLQKAYAGKSEKVIPINKRYLEVIRLTESGMSEVEVAKKLNMGKGEIELILGLNKN